ncbi:hypothetical protein AB832_07230 [Flavobacteriaceae bacterium (ex Bugula neritina AB1)]|nr:hypothetical protein AB832_07230 [Flavobacteriaceae bacterium (ex Bugula neritina AB1)]
MISSKVLKTQVDLLKMIKSEVDKITEKTSNIVADEVIKGIKNANRYIDYYIINYERDQKDRELRYICWLLVAKQDFTISMIKGHLREFGVSKIADLGMYELDDAIEKFKGLVSEENKENYALGY